MSTTSAVAGVTETASRLRLAVTRTARRLRQEAAGDLTPTAAAALATIERHGPITPSELAEIERIRRPTATRTLGFLTEERLVDRTQDPADGRSALVTISGKGRERLRRLRSRKNAYLARRMRELSPSEVETLEKAAQILDGILASERPPRGREVGRG